MATILHKHKWTTIRTCPCGVSEVVKKTKKKKRGHDCPYKDYGESCQCDEDWLEERK